MPQSGGDSAGGAGDGRPSAAGAKVMLMRSAMGAKAASAAPALQAASAEIAQCKKLVEQTATRCERWRATHA